MKKITIFEAEPGMILARPVRVLDKSGVELMQAGFVLQRKHIKKLNQWGIESIYIETYEDSAPIESIFPEGIRLMAHMAYEDAIASLTKMSKVLLSGSGCDLGEISRNVTNVLDVISMEPGLLSLLSMVKESEEYIYQHCVDVCVVSLVIARYLKCGEEELLTLGAACLLHDVGLLKFGKDFWDNSLITKNPSEIAIHPVFSRDIAGSTKGIDPRVLVVIEQHHEMVDGSGYPGQLAGDAIDYLSSIITVCEAYCTLICPLNAANAIAPHEAINAILDPRFNRFSPTILRAFISNISLYPSGTFVELNNSIRAVVLSSNTDKPMRPKILVLFDDANRPVKPFPVDLSELKYRDWFIERVIPGTSITDTLGNILKI